MDMNNAQMFGAADNFAILVNRTISRAHVLRGAVRNVRRGEPDDVQPGELGRGLGPNAPRPRSPRWAPSASARRRPAAIPRP